MKHSIALPLTLILLGATARLLPHPPNFAPIAAVAIFSGMYLKQWWGFAIPLAAMLASDAVIGFYSRPIMASVYAGFFISFLIGRLMAHKNSLSKSSINPSTSILIIGGTVLSSILFFLLTNWAVWIFGTVYPHTLHGLFESYVMAIPFFRNSLLGDLFYTGVLVGTMELIGHWAIGKHTKKTNLKSAI